MFRLILFLCVIVLTSCGGRCIEPGGGSGSIEVVVPVLPEGADRKKPSTYWINSGQKVEKGKELKVTVERAINFCPKDSSNPVTVRMFDDLMESKEWYYSTHLNVVEDDQLSFSPVLYDVEVTRCDDIATGNKRILYYGNSEFYKDDKGANAVSAATLCANGGGVDFSQMSNAASSKGSNTSASGSSSTIIVPPTGEKLYMKTAGSGTRSVGGNSTSGYTELPVGATIPRIAGSVIKTPRLEYPIGYFGPIKIENGSLETEPKDVVVNGIVHDARTMRSEEVPKLDGKNCNALKKYYGTKSSFPNFEGVNKLVASSSAKKEIIKYEKTQQATVKGTTQDAQNQEEKATIESILQEYTEYDINCNCGFICDPTQSSSKVDCIRSIVLVGDSNKLMCPTTTKAKMGSKHNIADINEKALQSLEGATSNDDLLKKVKSLTSIHASTSIDTDKRYYELAEGAVAWIVEKDSLFGQAHNHIKQFIGGRATNGGASRSTLVGLHMVPFFGHSLEMHGKYKVRKPGTLYLAYSIPQSSNSEAGGAYNGYATSKMKGYYAISVHRTCYASDGKDLYMYVGDSAPDFLPGDTQGSNASENNNRLKKGQMDFRAPRRDIEDYDGVHVINATNSVRKKKGTIYFGIKVDPSYEAQLREYGNEDNYYLARLWVPTWSPIFSQFFAYLQGSLLHVLYGTAVPTLDSNSKIGTDISLSIRQALEGKPSTSKQRKTIGAVQQIYNNQVTSKPFWSAVMALLTLYLMFAVLGYILGVTQLTKYDLMIRLSKVTMILLLISPNSWDFFYDHCFSIFVAGIPEIITAFNGYLGGDTSFAFLDSTLGVMFSSDVWLRMLSLLTAGPVGWLIMVAVMWAMVVFFVAVLKAMLKYLMITLTLAFLVTLAPIFITFLLFQFTRGVFDAWLKMIVNFSLQPIILFAALAFLNQVILSSLYTITNFTACETCALGIDIPSDDPESPNKKDICIIPALLPVGFSNELSVQDRIREDAARLDVGFMGLPFGVTVTMILILACLAVKEFAHVADIMAHSISGSVAGITASTVGATQALLGVVGLDDATQNLIRQARSMTPVGDEKVRFEAEDNVTPRHVGRHIDDPVLRDGGSSGITDTRKVSDLDPGVDVAAGYSGTVEGKGGSDEGAAPTVAPSDSRPRVENNYDALYAYYSGGEGDVGVDKISTTSGEENVHVEEMRSRDQLGDGVIDYAAMQERIDHREEQGDGGSESVSSAKPEEGEPSAVTPEERVEAYDVYTGSEGGDRSLPEGMPDHREEQGDRGSESVSSAVASEERVEAYDVYTGSEVGDRSLPEGMPDHREEQGDGGSESVSSAKPEEDEPSAVTPEERVEAYDVYTGSEGGDRSLPEGMPDHREEQGVPEEEGRRGGNFSDELKKTSTDTDNASLDKRDDE